MTGADAGGAKKENAVAEKLLHGMRFTNGSVMCSNT
jgi:hypothetical protein